MKNASMLKWIAALLVLPGVGFAQVAMPPPSNPVVFCGTQATPIADSYELVFDGGAAQALTMDAQMNAGCQAGSTHSFSVAANRFTVGTHSVMVRGRNAFGVTDGPTYSVLVGIAPGAFTINAVIGP